MPSWSSSPPSGPRGGSSVADLRAAAVRVEEHLNKKLIRLVSPYLPTPRQVVVGYGLVFENPLVMADRLVSRLVDEAWTCVRVQRRQRDLQRRCTLQEVLLEDKLATVFQPVVDLRDNSVLGHEALSRGPEGTVFHAPLRLFELAKESDLAFELDRKCRRRALLAARGLPAGKKLFINVLPSALYDPEFQGQSLVAQLDQLGLSPDRIVLEITEKYAIENYGVFAEALARVHPAGLQDRGRRRGRGLLRPREDRAPQPQLPEARPRAHQGHRLELHPSRDVAGAQGVRGQDRLHHHRRGHRARGRAHVPARAGHRVRAGLPPGPARRAGLPAFLPPGRNGRSFGLAAS